MTKKKDTLYILNNEVVSERIFYDCALDYFKEKAYDKLMSEGFTVEEIDKNYLIMDEVRIYLRDFDIDLSDYEDIYLGEDVYRIERVKDIE